MGGAARRLRRDEPQRDRFGWARPSGRIPNWRIGDLMADDLFSSPGAFSEQPPKPRTQDLLASPVEAAPTPAPTATAGRAGAASVRVPATSSALGTYQPGLDGMRGVAVLVVLGYHGELPWTQGAFLGISQFFTLSGFLIMGVLLRRHLVPGGELRSFWARRARRLMPAAFLALTGILVFGATVATRQQVQALPGDVIGAATWSANWRFVIAGKSYVNLFAAPSPVTCTTGRSSSGSPSNGRGSRSGRCSPFASASPSSLQSCPIALSRSRSCTVLRSDSAVGLLCYSPPRSRLSLSPPRS